MLYRLPIVALSALLLAGCGAQPQLQSTQAAPMETQPPLDTIRREHEVIRKVTAAARKDAVYLQESESVDRDRMNKYVDFFANFTDACHHRKEELYLFPSVAWHDRDQVLIDSLKADHDAGRRLLNRMRSALSDSEAVDAKALATALLEYADMIETHIESENTQFLPAADAILAEPERKRLAEGYIYVEHTLLGEGFHQEYHALAHSLIAQEE